MRSNTIINKIRDYDISLYLLFAILSLGYFSIAFQNLLVPIFVLSIIVAHKSRIVNIDRKVLLLISIPFLLTLIAFIYSNNFDEALKTLLRRSLLPLLGIFILCLDTTPSKFIRGFRLFLIASLVASLITIIKGVFLYTESGVFFHPNFTQYFTVIHHPNFAAYVLMALIIFGENHKNFKLSLYVKITVFLIFIVAIIISTARIAQLVLLVYGLYKAYKILKSGNRTRIIILGLIALAAFFTVNNNLETLSYKYKRDLDLSKSPRVILWKNATAVIMDNTTLFKGVGVGDYQEALDHMLREKYKTSDPRIDLAGLNGYNTHNQYLEFIGTNGALGLLYLLSIAYLIYLSLKSKRTEFIMYTVFIGAFLFTECVLNRQTGIYLLGILTPLLYITSINRND